MYLNHIEARGLSLLGAETESRKDFANPFFTHLIDRDRGGVVQFLTQLIRGESVCQQRGN